VQHSRGVVLVGMFVYNDTHIVTIIPTCSKCAIGPTVSTNISLPLYIYLSFWQILTPDSMVTALTEMADFKRFTGLETKSPGLIGLPRGTQEPPTAH